MFAGWAGRELAARGETLRRRTAETHDQLTPQEAQIARLARAGMSNPEIAAQLFLSVHTIEWHLRKVFTKLEISSCLQLQRALPDNASAGPMAQPDTRTGPGRQVGHRPLPPALPPDPTRSSPSGIRGASPPYGPALT